MSLFEISGAKSHTQFAKYIEQIVENKEEREAYYDKIVKSGMDDSVDLFRDYFEEVNAERKSNKQDYTPTEVAELLSSLTLNDSKSTYDGAAGTGTLIISAWVHAGKPSDYYVCAWEYADNVIPYLIHNLAIRNIRADIIHGDTLTQEKLSSYSLKPSDKYSEVIKCG